MSNNPKSKDMEQLMAEADDLIRQIDSEFIRDMEETRRLEFEKHAENLQKIKSEVHGKTEDKDALETSSGAEGMHEAIQEIVKAFQGFKKKDA